MASKAAEQIVDELELAVSRDEEIEIIEAALNARDEQAAKIAERVAAESGTDGNAGPAFTDSRAREDAALEIARNIRRGEIS